MKIVLLINNSLQNKFFAIDNLKQIDLKLIVAEKATNGNRVAIDKIIEKCT